MRRTPLPALILAACALVPSYAAERATINGKVLDALGAPVPNATVMVYKAGVKTGYSTYCPTCYVDCGKHVVTGADGAFTLTGLSPDLLFTLLVLHDGHSTATLKQVDPAKNPAETAVLKTRAPVDDPSRLVRGRVVDGKGAALTNAVVEQQGVFIRGPNGMMGQSYGDGGWTDIMAVSNANGEFEIAYGKPAEKLILSVAARGMAAKLFTEPTGPERQTLTVAEGATVRGRLLYKGKPVTNAELGLSSHSRRSGFYFPEVRIGTQEDGTFAIANVPAGRVWTLYPKMESLASRALAGGAIDCETKDNGEDVNVGDIELAPAYRLSGQVVLTNGQPIPAGMRVGISADRAADSQTVTLPPDGKFEFAGLGAGVYSIFPSVKGYELADGPEVETVVKRDVQRLTIRVQPVAAKPK